MNRTDRVLHNPDRSCATYTVPPIFLTVLTATAITAAERYQEAVQAAPVSGPPIQNCLREPGPAAAEHRN
jgi:hypothetical protein